MMCYLTACIDYDLAEELRAAGMDVNTDTETYDSGTEYERTENWSDTTFAEVIDWLLDKGLSIEITKCFDFANEMITPDWEYAVVKPQSIHSDYPTSKKTYDDWLDAATDAIRAALKLIINE